MQLNTISAVLSKGIKEKMESPNIIEKVLYLSSKGWDKRRIAKKFGINPTTPLNTIDYKRNSFHIIFPKELRNRKP